MDTLPIVSFTAAITVHHGALAYLLGINALRASEAAAVRRYYEFLRRVEASGPYRVPCPAIGRRDQRSERCAHLSGSVGRHEVDRASRPRVVDVAGQKAAGEHGAAPPRTWGEGRSRRGLDALDDPGA